MRVMAAVSACAAGSLASVALGQCDVLSSQRFLPADPEEWKYFGVSVSSDAGLAMIGATDGMWKWGSAHAYQWDGSSWALVQTMSGGFDSGWASTVRVWGEWAFICAPSAGPHGENEGGVSIYRWEGGSWEPAGGMSASDDYTPHDSFGCSISVDGGRAVVGALTDESLGFESGAAYVFGLSGGIWVRTQRVQAPSQEYNNGFGASVAMSGDWMIVGAPWSDPVGAAYVFRWNGSKWVVSQQLALPEGVVPQFGRPVAIEGDTAVVCARYPGVDPVGEAYVYRYDGDSWTFRARLAPGDDEEVFARSLAIDAGRIVVGAASGLVDGARPGVEYVYEQRGPSWVLTRRLVASEAVEGDQVGSSVWLDGATVFVGASRTDVGAEDSGAAYVFDLAELPGDFDGDGALNVLDFVAFQIAWVAEDPRADCDGDGEFRVLDFVCYSEAFQAGCP